MKVYEQQSNIGWKHFARGRWTIEWGTLINSHLAKQSHHKFNAEHWGSKLLGITWKHILSLWTIRNNEVKGETPEKAEQIQRKTMIDEILHIRSTLTNLSIEDSELVNRDVASLRATTLSSLSTYLYGARMLAESYNHHTRQEINRTTITDFFKPRRRQRNNKTDESTDTVTQQTTT
jgi:hypothetical protein